MLAVWVIGGIIAYVVGMFITFPIVNAALKAHTDIRYQPDRNFYSSVAIIVWPPALVGTLAYLLVRAWIDHDPDETSQSRSQKKQIAAVRHEIEMAKLRAELEDIETARLERMR